MKNRRGFTLTELLVTMVILGILIAISIPLIRNVQEQQTKKKYKLYGETLTAGAKLYKDSYEEDLFDQSKGLNSESTCIMVPYSILYSKKVIKDIDIPNVSCNSSDTMVRIVKMGKTYGYAYQMGCGEKKGDKATNINYRFPQNERIQCTGNGLIVKEDGSIVYGVFKEDGSIEENKEIAVMDIKALPEKADKDYNSASRKTKIQISSVTGVAQGADIKYAWVKNWDTSSSNYTSVTGWKDLPYSKYPAQKTQLTTIKNGKAVDVISKYIQTPSNASGDYYLILDIEKLCNAIGEGCINKAGKYKVFGPYKIDNGKPTIQSLEVKSTTASYNNKTAVVSFSVTDDQIAAHDLSICISKKACEDGDYKKYNNNYEMKLSDTQDGKEYTVYFGVKDKAGNKATTSAKYKLYKDCTEKVNDEKWVDSSSCSKKCGGGTKNQTSGYKDKYSGEKCDGTNTKSVSCNTMDCCSKISSKTTCDGWSGWSSCTKTCGTGTRSHSRTCYKLSDYDGRKCQSYIDTATENCNTQGCCSSTYEVHVSYSGWSSCSSICGAGSQSRTQTYYLASSYTGAKCTGNYTRSVPQTCYNYSGCCNSTHLANGRWERYTSCQRVHHTGKYVIFEYTYKYRERYVYDRISDYNGQYCSTYNTSQTRAQDSIFCW